MVSRYSTITRESYSDMADLVNTRQGTLPSGLCCIRTGSGAHGLSCSKVYSSFFSANTTRTLRT